MIEIPAISIVTPSFNMRSVIEMCHASVSDQGVDFEHIVADGGSTDGTVEWLNERNDIVSISESDNGMYDALNKAIMMARGKIIGHLNCDEQYLPGILKFVLDFFKNNPDADFLAADFLVISPDGALIAFRKAFQPRWPYFFSNYLYTTTSTLFYRREVFSECRFDDSYKSIADVIFLYNVMKKGFKGIHVRKYFSVFIFSGKNLSLNPISDLEKIKFNASLPFWYKMLKPLFFFFFFIEKMLNGTYLQKSPLYYSIFTSKNINERTAFISERPTFRLKFSRPNI